jgi:hypothetical protein
MQSLYFILAAVHLVAIVVTGILWTIIDVANVPKLREYVRDIRAVHFGSLYLVPLFLGLAYAFERLHVPGWHQAIFPIGLAALIVLSGAGYLFPRPPDLASFYYWTRGWPLALAIIGIICLVSSLLWTAAILICYTLK